MAISQQLSASRGRLLGLLAARNKRREAEYQKRLNEVEQQKRAMEAAQAEAESDAAKGGWLGSTAKMAATGAMLGSVVPGLGTALGAGIGAGAGFLLSAGKGVHHGMTQEGEGFWEAAGDTLKEGVIHADPADLIQAASMAAPAMGGQKGSAGMNATSMLSQELQAPGDLEMPTAPPSTPAYAGGDLQAPTSNPSLGEYQLRPPPSYLDNPYGPKKR